MEGFGYCFRNHLSNAFSKICWVNGLRYLVSMNIFKNHFLRNCHFFLRKKNYFSTKKKLGNCFRSGMSTNDMLMFQRKLFLKTKCSRALNFGHRS